MTTTIYRNDTTGYTVTLIDNGKGARVVDSLNYDFPMVGSDYPHAAVLARSRAHLNGAVLVATPEPTQMTSPLAPAAQVPASNLAAGAKLTEPSLPQARCLDWAVRVGRGIVRRGPVSLLGNTAPLTVLIAMKRRGWFTISEDRSMALITDTGRRVLSAYVTKHGEVA